MRRAALGLGAVSIAALLLMTPTVRAAGIADEVAGTIASAFEESLAEVAALEGELTPQAKLELAKLLAAGLPISAANPLPKPDIAAANALIDELVATGTPELRRQALAVRASVLRQSDLLRNVKAGEALEAELAAEGHAPALARLILANAPLPETLTIEGAVQLLEPRVLDGDYVAIEALAQLLRDTDPERSASLSQQALVALTVKSSTSVSAATELGRRYLFGVGVVQDTQRALTLFEASIADGANAPLGILDAALEQRVDGLEAAAVRALIVRSLARGSSKAAELIANDVIESPKYGFGVEDARYAAALMAETGSRAGMLLAAKAYARGLGSAPDLSRALPYIEALANVEGFDPDAVLDVGDDLESLDLPLHLALTHIEPLYRAISDESAEAEYRADRLLAAATEAGIVSPSSIGPARIDAMLAALKLAGFTGHTRSLILLGDLYAGGIWVPMNPRQALQIYEQALAASPDLVTRERIAKTLLVVKNTPFEEERYERLIGELAAEGSPWARYRQGVLLIEKGADVAQGEAILSELASAAYAPAVRALLKHIQGVRDPARIDKAVEAFSAAWNIRKDVRIGKLLGEFYVLAGRPEQARAVLGDPIFTGDAEALLALAQLAAAGSPPNQPEVLALARQGLEAATGNERLQLAFVDLMRGLNLEAARSESEAALLALADAGSTDAMTTLIPAYIERAAQDAEALQTVAAWSDTLARTGEERPILDLATRYLTRDADAEVAAQVLEIADRALDVLPAESYLSVLVAQAYFGGIGTGKNVERGNLLIERAAAAGNKDALAELGMQYFYGMGRGRNPETALALLDSAAALGSNVARVELGRLFSSSTGPRVDMMKAYSMFLRAAEDGSTAGMLELGRLYLAGWGIARDEVRGVDWLEQAAALGNTDAMYQLYFHYLSKDNPADEQVALDWLKRSSDSGVDPARLRLAERMLSEDRSANYDAALALLDAAYANGYNLAGKYKRSVIANGAVPPLHVPGEVPQ